MKLLAIDCSARLCAACIHDAAADRELGRVVLDLGKGHAKHLAGVVEEVMGEPACSPIPQGICYGISDLTDFIVNNNNFIIQHKYLAEKGS